MPAVNASGAMNAYVQRLSARRCAIAPADAVADASPLAALLDTCAGAAGAEAAAVRDSIAAAYAAATASGFSSP